MYPFHALVCWGGSHALRIALYTVPMLDLNVLPLPMLFGFITNRGEVERLLDAAFQEDLHDAGDITSQSIISAGTAARASVTLRQPGVIAGLPIANRLCEEDSGLSIELRVKDGQQCQAGQTLAIIEGDLRGLLSIERTMLNILGRLSGIATLTRQYVDAIADTNAVICDTRKTTPGLRNLEKYAVRCGGGTLHRLGLFDAALYKDNHLAGIPLDQLGGRLAEAARQVRERHEVRFVEVEVDNFDQLQIVLNIERGLIDFVLLDNMPPDKLREAVRMRDALNPAVKLEASGGVNLNTVRAIAESGVDRISVGALTHSAPCLDIGLDIE